MSIRGLKFSPPTFFCKIRVFHSTHSRVVHMNIMEERTSEDWAGRGALARARRRLPIALLGNAFMRIAGGASGVLVGLYLADLANRGRQVDAALVGTLGAVSFGAELLS